MALAILPGRRAGGDIGERRVLAPYAIAVHALIAAFDAAAVPTGHGGVDAGVGGEVDMHPRPGIAPGGVAGVSIAGDIVVDVVAVRTGGNTTITGLGAAEGGTYSVVQHAIATVCAEIALAACGLGICTTTGLGPEIINVIAGIAHFCQQGGALVGPGIRSLCDHGANGGGRKEKGEKHGGLQEALPLLTGGCGLGSRSFSMDLFLT